MSLRTRINVAILTDDSQIKFLADQLRRLITTDQPVPFFTARYWGLCFISGLTVSHNETCETKRYWAPLGVIRGAKLALGCCMQWLLPNNLYWALQITWEHCRQLNAGDGDGVIVSFNVGIESVVRLLIHKLKLRVWWDRHCTAWWQFCLGRKYNNFLLGLVKANQQ